MNPLTTSMGDPLPLPCSLAVNVCAPFLLTALLLPRLVPGARVVITSSISQGCADRLDDLNLSGGWDSHTAYSLSKLCDAMITLELHARYGANYTFLTMDPGTVNTKMLLAGWGACGIEVEQANDSFVLLSDPRFANAGGKYFVGCKEHRANSAVYSPEKRTKLFERLALMTKAPYP
eukprot:NODE_1148_length_1262_cov_52.603462_g937_i0.p1 GENE.NODE_1148_length_1262_cov_52.603462_g937_i0~~NODE_1148_length_1262_cov_52.603462_g937_i0.p1  ORF type:complete len:177 (-),score=33.66 NODE_1148_length_1262_cov_52.603462_g937_i0:165-695(-)